VPRETPVPTPSEEIPQLKCPAACSRNTRSDLRVDRMAGRLGRRVDESDLIACEVERANDFFDGASLDGVGIDYGGSEVAVSWDLLDRAH